MHYFNADFLQFFKDLSKNNNRDWFHSQQKRYEASVKDPFYNFLTDYIQAIQKKEKGFNIQAKDCVLRINRDLRFSKDKTPYNLYYTAFVSKYGRKNKNCPGIFLRFSPAKIDIMGGCFRPEKEQLHKIRTRLSTDALPFKKVIQAKNFRNKFGEIQGERMKRIPKEWKSAAEKEPFILNKQYYFIAERKPDLLLSEALLAEFMDYWNCAKPVNDYLLNCIQ